MDSRGALQNTVHQGQTDSLMLWRRLAEIFGEWHSGILCDLVRVFLGTLRDMCGFCEFQSFRVRDLCP